MSNEIKLLFKLWVLFLGLLASAILTIGAVALLITWATKQLGL